MAYDPTVIPASKVVASLEDYTGTPVSYTLGIVEVNSITPKLLDAIASEEIFVTSSTGRSRYANPTTGLAGGQSYSFTVLMVDPKNVTDTTAHLGLLRSLAGNSVAGTGYSGNDYSSQLTGGGKLQVKVKFAFTSEGGTTHTFTMPSCIDTVEPSVSGEHMSVAVNATLVGAVTIA